MPEPLVIRVANTDDVPALLDLYQHLIPGDTHPSPDEAADILNRFMSYDGSQIFIGVLAGQLVASCTLVVVPNLTRGGSPYALIENMVTHKSYRRRGHGQLVLHQAPTAAWRAGCYKTMLLTGSADPATLGFCAAAGFEQSKTGFQLRRIPARDAG